MVHIPSQLEDCRFILVQPQSKQAFEKDWQSTANYGRDDPKLREWVSKGNYGVVAGSTHCIIDTDDPELTKLVETTLPATFTVASPGHNGKHFYYRYNGTVRTIPILDKSRAKDQQNIGHARIGGGYTVGPGSTHPNGRIYTIESAIPLASINEEQLLTTLAPYIAQRAKAVETKSHSNDVSLDFNILQLIDTTNMQRHGDTYLGPHPIHGSTTGTNFHVDPTKNLWFCFRCCSGGSSLQLLAVLEGILECDEAIPGALRGELFKRTKQAAVEKGYIQNEPAKPKTVKRLELGPNLPALELPVASDDEKLEPHEVAQAVLKSWDLVTMADTEEVLIYKNGVYTFGAEQLLAQAIERFYTEAGTGEQVKTHFWNEVLGHIQRASYTDRKHFDADPYILNLQNGLLDVRDCTLKPHTSEYLSIVQLPIRFDATAKCPHFTKFLGEVLHPGDEQPLQEYCGSILWKNYEHQTGLLLDGGGSNGKDTFLSTIKAVVGAANTSARSLQDLELNRFAPADLYGKLWNVYADLSDTELRSVAKFKMATGGSTITAERKFGQPFSFVNFAKLVFSCNKIPMTSEDTVAFFRRWMLITFPNTFEGPTDDRELPKRLVIPEELSGVLNWMIAGLKRLRENKWKFSYSKSVEDVRVEYTRKSSPIQAFMMDCCKQEPLTEVPKKTLYTAFLTYARPLKLALVQYPTFCRNLLTIAKVEECKPMVLGHRTPSFRGLKLREEKMWGKDEDEPSEKPAKDKPKGQDQL